VAMVENVHDVVQEEASRLREELKGTGHSLPFLLLAGPGPRVVLAAFNLDASHLCWCRGEGGGRPLDGAASGVPGGGRQATSPPRVLGHRVEGASCHSPRSLPHPLPAGRA
jgi:hypothetical protein